MTPCAVDDVDGIEARCREIVVWLDDQRFVDSVSDIIRAAWARTPDDLLGVAGGLIAALGALSSHMDEAERVSLARHMLCSARRLDRDVLSPELPPGLPPDGLALAGKGGDDCSAFWPLTLDG
jgi:hypothetical protein